jgi:hypothetical protein
MREGAFSLRWTGWGIVPGAYRKEELLLEAAFKKCYISINAKLHKMHIQAGFITHMSLKLYKFAARVQIGRRV